MAEEGSQHVNQLVVFVGAFTRIAGAIMYIRCHMSREDTAVTAIKLCARGFTLPRPAIS